MTVFSYHLVRCSFFSALKMMFFPIKGSKINGLIYAETMSVIILGSPIYSISRFFSRKIAVFAQWENKNAINLFLKTDPLGKKIASGWHIRLRFLRQWGTISGFKIPLEEVEPQSQNEPLVAIFKNTKYHFNNEVKIKIYVGL